MNRKSIVVFAGALLASAVSLGVHEQPAFARTIPATAGLPQLLGNQMAPFAGWAPGSFGGIVFTATPNFTGVFSIPLVFDNPGARNITVRGNVTPGTTLACRAYAFSTNGLVASFSAMPSFVAGPTVVTVTLSLNSIPAGAYGKVDCSFGGRSELISVDYAP